MTDQPNLSYIEYTPLSDLLGWDRNPKDHDIPSIKKSITRFGFTAPILVDERTKRIVAGHGRLESLKALQAQGVEPPARISKRDDGEWLVPVLRGISFNSDSEIEAYLIADNQLTIAGGWDQAKLGSIMADLEKLGEGAFEGLGFDQAEIDAILTNLANQSGDGARDQAKRDQARRTLSEAFIVPPFSTLDARQGYWQDRKRAWIGLGINSELGRGQNLLKFSPTAQIGVGGIKPKGKNGKPLAEAFTSGKPGSLGKKYSPAGLTIGQVRFYQREDDPETGTSIFDPVLSEVLLSWFCPKDGAVLDPFAGGSVRGIVSGFLGHSYTGIDLSADQISANQAQAKEILSPADPVKKDQGKTEPIKVKISARMAKLKFNGCDPDYIRNVCHASCCQSSTSPTGTMITINPFEEDKIKAIGGVVIDGLLQPRSGEKVCPFKTKDHLCSLHFTENKPFGCIASPFTLNNNNTLIVRNRYRLLKCYDDGNKIPAYKAFRASLDLIFGKEEAERICASLDKSDDDVTAYIKPDIFDILVVNDEIKHGKQPSESQGSSLPNWIIGDSQNLDNLIPADQAFDFILSCPPYHDLEQYSQDPADLSNMSWDQFSEAYTKIIGKAVSRLREDRFAAFVVGEIRHQKGGGFYKGLIPLTIAAFEAAGARFYNDMILITAIGSLPIRIGKQFVGNRKICKTHQNILLFYKGNPDHIKDIFPPAVPVADLSIFVDEVQQPEI